jgi:hypothetical protein
VLEGGVSKMADRNRDYRTGERVAEPGGFVCEVGQRRDLREGDEFPTCPESGRETTWKREQ